MTIQWQSYIRRRGEDVGMSQSHKTEQQAREWVALEREEYGDKMIQEAIVQRREVGPWETVA